MASSACGVTTRFLVLALVISTPARAAEPARHVELVWKQNDPACMTAADLATAVEQTLDRPVFHADDPPVARLVGSIGRVGPDSFEAQLRLEAMDGTTLVERPPLTTTHDCHRLDEQVAFVATRMIDSIDKAPAPPPVPETPPAPQVAPPAPPPPPPPPPAPPPPPLPPKGPRRALPPFTLGVGAGISSSLLPGIAAEVSVRGEVGLPWVPLALALRFHAPSSVSTDNMVDTFSAWTAELAGCPAWSSTRVRVGACAGVGAGQVILVHTTSSAGAGGNVQPVVLASVLPALAVRLVGPVWIRAEGGLLIPLLREPWVVNVDVGKLPQTQEVVYQPGALVVLGGLSLEVKIGS